MTLIPQLEDQLVAAAVRVGATPSRRLRPRVSASRRAAVIAFAVVLALSAVAGAASIIVREGKPVAPAPRTDFPPGVQFPAPSTGVIAATTPDPAGGPAWGVRLARSASGSPCVAAGRVLHGQLGKYDAATTTFRRLPLRGPGSCGITIGANEVAWFIDQRFAFRTEPARTVLYGVAGANVRRLVALGPGGDRPVPISRKRAFITVYEKSLSAYQLPLVAHMADGSSKTYAGRNP